MLSARPDQSVWTRGGIALFVLLFSSVSLAETLVLVDEILTQSSLSGTVVTMSGRSELHLTNGTSPLSGCTVHLNSEDAWLFLENIKPSTAATATYLGQVKVSGASAALNTNVRVVEYASGAVIIPQPSTFQPLEVFTGENFTGDSVRLNQYTAYDTGALGAMANSIRSFILKRGYTVTFAQNANGTGYSRNYVAQDCDLEIGVLGAKLDGRINFVRVFPWRWVSKKGIGGNIGQNLDIKWWYNWNLDQNSTLDKEYVPIRQNRWWPGLGQDWKARGASQLLGYNEPDRPDQANLAVGDAIWSWPDLLGTGLRVGSPAVSDGGLSWLYSFMDEAKTADLRVDFVAVHYYRCANPADPAAAASQMYNFLKDIYDRTGKPIWITEWNNGANWTGCGDPTFEQQASAIGAMIDMLDSTPFVERYAPYNWVEDCRRLQWDDGWPTAAGEVYRDQVSPIGYRQEAYGSGKSANAIYAFEADGRDSSGNGNHALVYGAPEPAAGRHGNGLALDGTNDYLTLGTHMGEGTDFTFAGWVYWNGGANWQRIFDFGKDTNSYMFLTPSASGQLLRFTITTSGWGGEQRMESGTLPVGTWTHVAVTLSGNTGRLYVNGAQVDSKTISLNPSSLGSVNHYLGKSQFSVDPLFAGMLDEVVIADYALSAGQVASLAFESQPARYVTAPLNIVGAVAGAEEAGGAAIHSHDRDRDTRWANDGTVANAWIRYDLGSVQEIDRIKLRLNVGSSRTYPLRIEVDGAVVFNGQTTTSSGYWETAFAPVSGRYVMVTMTGNNSSGNSWFSIWEAQVWGPGNEPPAFAASVFSEADAAESFVYGGTLAGRASDPEGGAVTFSKDAGPDWLTVAADGTLAGVPGDRDRGTNTFTVRVTDEGGFYDTAEMTVEVANVFTGVRGLEDLAGLASHWLMGMCGDYPVCGGADPSGDGYVDLADLTAVSRRWMLPEELMLLLPFEETSGDAAADRSVYGRTASLVNGPTWASGFDGGALAFDGVDDYVRVDGCKGVDGDAARTCAFWVKTTDAACDFLSWGRLYGEGGAVLTGQKWQVLCYNGELGAVVQGGNVVCSAPELADNQWRHVAITLDDFNGDGTVNIDEGRLYVDGVLKPTSRSLPQAVNTAAYHDVHIGRYPEGGTQYFGGLLDDVRIYDRALSDMEIGELAAP